MSGKEVAHVWTLHRFDPEGIFNLNLLEGKSAVCFSTEGKAKGFRKAVCPDEERVKVVGMDGAFFVEWMRNLYKSGITFICKDLPHLKCKPKPTPIFKVLAAVEGVSEEVPNASREQE